MLPAAMSEDQYAQELECSSEAAIVGAYYGKIIAALEEKQFFAVPHDPALLVDVWFDLGSTMRHRCG